MVLIYTENEQLDKDLDKKIHNSRIVFDPFRLEDVCEKIEGW